jgi:perosamine synthetase
MTTANSEPADDKPLIRLARPDIDEREIDAVARVLSSGVLTNGPETKAFEAAFAARHDVAHGVAMANGTLALSAILIALGVGPGDEVIVPSMTFVSTATCVLHVGATPVFADIDPETFNLDPLDVKRRIGPSTAAVIPVHYGGQAADMTELVEAAGTIPVIEDAAEAHGAHYKGRAVGGWATAGMFSFTPTKNITTGEGGWSPPMTPSWPISSDYFATTARQRSISTDSSDTTGG